MRNGREPKQERDAERRSLMRGEDKTVPNTELCGELVSVTNIAKAIRKVKANKGAAGADGMDVSMLDEHFARNWGDIRSRILARTYKPSPVLRVEIPKDNGGVRLLGIPTVTDRVIQQAIVQVLTPVFEPTFSDFSFGFRPKRSAEDAVRLAQTYMSEGYKRVVDLDLSKFFDTVDHDILMGLVDKHMHDKDIRRLIFTFLESGIVTSGCMTATAMGTPQGGPLSPLLSNIYLTPYDKELESRGLRFVRYADDCNIFVKSMIASRRVEERVISYLERKLKLKVNMEKTEARKAVGSKFLGFEFITNGRKERLGKLRPAEKKRKKLEDRIREITSRSRGVKIETVIRELNATLRGWVSYFARGNFKIYLQESLMPWVRRRVRQVLYKQWKNGRNRHHKLRQLGVEEWILKKSPCGSNSYWKMSKVMGRTLTNEVLEKNFGLVDIVAHYVKLHTQRMEADRVMLDLRYHSLFV
jgi:group II intron reverse transcriptase/maturase